MLEDWVSLDDLGFDDYSVSSLGRVLNKVTDRIMALSKNQQGILQGQPHSSTCRTEHGTA